MKAARRSRRRPGYTLMEVITVIAILIILGGILVPTFSASSRDSRVKAGADVVRGRMEEARGNAIEDARPYRLSLSADGTRIRVAPDGFDEGEFEPQADDEGTPFVAEDSLPEGVTVFPQMDESTTTMQGDGWVRVATFLPDGTCKEDHAILEVRELGCYPLIVTLRGLTGSVSIKPGKLGGGR